MKTLLSIIISSIFTLHALGQDYLAQAKSGDKWGYINKKGEFVLQPQYEKCNAFGEDGLAPIYEKKRKSFYFIKSDGSELKTDADKFRLASVFGFGTKGFSEGMVAIQVGKKWGYMNTDGKTVVDAKYDKALEFGSGHGVAKLGSNFYIIDKEGNETKIDIKGLEDVRKFSEGFAPYRSNGKWGFINTSGKISLSAEYKGIGYLSNGLAWAKNDAGSVGFINEKGEMKIPSKYEAAKDFSDGIARVKSGTWTLVDASGNSINPPSADSYGKFSEDLAYAKKNDKVGFIDKSGKWVIEAQFEKVRDFSAGLAAVRENDKWGFVDKTGNWVIKPQFDAVKDFAPTGK